ncbi:MAG: hypothetical protein A2508_05530 [Candidatus Lambdaproteobacteria bacterium RIFOXYD12_FULL_49_8]|nr:MAG: hypothetical protein A2508_05530 [Candidatus Lambdaproteobacteria bacterium RIFOXYD12_FULL_49_8]
MSLTSDRQRILVVDDDGAIRRMILRTLRNLNVELFEAQNGEEALDKMAKISPHLILLDIKMPGMDGYQICRQIRANPANQLAKVILLSSLNRLPERLAGYQAGADLYLVKPFEEEELKALIRAFLKLRHAEEVEQLRTNLLQLVAHESRTPLNSILGYADLLVGGNFETSQLSQIAGEISRQGKRMLQQIEKADLYCRVTSDNYPLRPYQDNLAQVVGRLTKDPQFLGLPLILEIAPELELEFDWALMVQVLGFLLENAFSHNPEGQSVTLEARRQEGRLLIQVSDQGPGVLEENRQAIFKPFYTKSLMHHHAGQGLSLALSKRIVELHGGTLEVTGCPPQGAQFIISLPIIPTPFIDLESLGSSKLFGPSNT